MNNRTQRLREQVMARHGSFVPPGWENPFVLDVALWRAWTPECSVVQQRAAFLREQVRLARLYLPPEWRLAGEHLPRVGRGFAFAADGLPDLGGLGLYGLSEDQECAVRAVVQEWVGKALPQVPGHRFPSTGTPPDWQQPDGAGWGLGTVYMAGGWVENHSVRDYDRVLRKGFRGLLRDVDTAWAACDPTDPEFHGRQHFWTAARAVCEAGILLGQRYAEAAEEAAAVTANEQDRERLLHMAELCRRVPAEPARTLEEATQALWLAHVLTCGEDDINANSIGRLDQILNPFYLDDLEAGRLTRDEAVALMEELACKMYLDYDVQAIVLAGLDRNGESAVNDMSHILLEATANVEFVRDLSVRLSSKTPESFVEHCARLIQRGGGIPFLFNDDCFVHALHRRGIALEDARDYAPIGCIELTVPGKANPHAVSGWMNSTKCLELALFGGIDPRTQERLGPEVRSLTEAESFEQVYAAYMRQLEVFTRQMVYLCNRGALLQRDRGPLPCWSLLTDDCIARGRDITDGGSVYTYHSICFLGAANTADALAAVRKLVFEEGRVGAADLLQALRSDFQGAESLRRMLLNDAPKYGNDCPEVDLLVARVCRDFIELMDGFQCPFGGRFFVHLFSFLLNIAFGKNVGATPDGRRADEPLAYSLSAHQGRDQRGVSAMLSSLCRLPHAEAAGASAAIVDLDPKLVEGEGGLGRLVQLIRSAVAMGVGQLQWNVTTVERLRQAQADPERYGNIPVRVAGYSQLFKLVDRELQEHIIARTKHVR